MPEFILNKPRRATHAYYGLNNFAKGYVEAMFFTNGDTGDDREHLLNQFGVERLTRASVKAIADDCQKFWSANKRLLTLANIDAGMEWEQLGRDFWFTRQGHGVGFNDRPQLAVDVYETRLGSMWLESDKAIVSQPVKLVGRLDELLTKAAQAAGYIENVYVDRGWIHYG